MREKKLENYYMKIDNLYIDVVSINKVHYIKVLCSNNPNKKAIFDLKLNLISTTFDEYEIKEIFSIVHRNFRLLLKHEREMK